ncbi:MAG: hypothetical protein WB992_17385 [Bryobacteraceae bacterium]
MESLQQRADSLQKLLAALVTVGTIFGFALGLSTYFNLKELQQNAEKSAEKIQQDWEANLAEIRAAFP